MSSSRQDRTQNIAAGDITKMAAEWTDSYTVFWPIVFLNDKKEKERETNPFDRKILQSFLQEGGIWDGQSSTFGPVQSKGALSSSTIA